MPDTIRIGQIVGAWGLRGHVKVEPMTDFWERFEPGREVLLNGNWLKIASSSEQKGRLLLKLKGVDNATQAEGLQWSYIEGKADEEFDLEEDEYFTEDLIGLKVVTAAGRELGNVSTVSQYPAHDVLEIGEIQIPVVKEFIKEVDVEGGKIVVELIPGMIPGED